MEPSINGNTESPTFATWYRNQTPPRQRILKIIVLMIGIFFVTVFLTLILTLTPARFRNDKDPLPRLKMLGFRGSEDLEYLEYYNGTQVKNQTTGYYGSIWNPFACAYTDHNPDRDDDSTDFYCFTFDRMRTIEKLVRINDGKLVNEQVIPVAGNGYVESSIWDPKRRELITVDQAWFVRIIVYDRQGTQLRKMLLQMDSWWRLAKVALDVDRNILYYSPWYWTNRGGFKSIRGTNYVTGEAQIETEVPLPDKGSILDFVVMHSSDTEFDHLVILATENIYQYDQWHLMLLDFDPIKNTTRTIGHFPTEIGISPELWVHTVYDEERRCFFAVMWNNTATEESSRGEAVMVMVNTDYDYFTYIPLPGVVLPEEGDPYYYYDDSDSDDADSYSVNEGDQEGTADDSSTSTSTKRRTIRSLDDFKKLTETRTVKDYWPDYYYSIEAIAVL